MVVWEKAEREGWLLCDTSQPMKEILVVFAAGSWILWLRTVNKRARAGKEGPFPALPHLVAGCALGAALQFSVANLLDSPLPPLLSFAFVYLALNKDSPTPRALSLP